MASGRKRKQNVERSKSGRIAYSDRPEAPKNVMDVVKAQRMALGANDNNWRAQEWESELGRLWRSDEIDETQYSAIKQAIAIRHRFRITQGYPAESLKCIAGELVTGGGMGVIGFEPDEEWAIKCRRANADMMAIFAEFQGRGVQWVRAITKMALNEPLVPPEVGYLREAANVLARRWRM